MSMNTYKLDSLLEDSINYEDIGKVAFINKLADGFREDQTHGDYEYKMDIDNCNGCNCNQAVCKITGIVSGRTFALFFEFNKNKITDIYHCTWYSDVNSEYPF